MKKLALVLTLAPLASAGVLAAAGGGEEQLAGPLGIFESRLGSWDLEYTIRMSTGETKGAGIETYRATAGGEWMVVDFDGSFFGEPYTSHAVVGFDGDAGTYVSWSFDPYLELPTRSEGSWDEGRARS
ncbi:MAG: DUF1579 family protein [Planctomycetota bacterium]